MQMKTLNFINKLNNAKDEVEEKVHGEKEKLKKSLVVVCVCVCVSIHTPPLMIFFFF